MPDTRDTSKTEEHAKLELEFEQAIDSLSAILRTLGGHPLTADPRERASLKDVFDAWARHISVLASHPERGDQRSVTHRDWRGLTQMVLEHRRREQGRLVEARTRGTERPATSPNTRFPLPPPSPAPSSQPDLPPTGPRPPAQPRTGPLSTGPRAPHLPITPAATPRPTPSPISPRPPASSPATTTSARPSTSLSPRPPQDQAERELVQAIEAVVGMLRAMERHPLPGFASPQASRLDAWIRHIAALGPHPLMSNAQAVTRRDWGGLVTMIAEERLREQQEVRATINQLSSAIWDLTQTATRAATSETSTDKQLAHRIEKLRASLRTHLRPEDLREQVRSFATEVEELVDQRERARRKESETVARQLRQLFDQLNRVKHESEQDALTRIYNRRALDRHLGQIDALASLGRSQMALVVFDVDRFKHFNDTYGHPVGDAILSLIASHLAAHFILPSDFVARFGGDEFVVFLGDAELSTAWLRVDAFRKSLHDLAVPGMPASERVTISIGIAELGPEELTAHCLSRADDGLRYAKGTGRGQIGVVDNDGSIQLWVQPGLRNDAQP